MDQLLASREATPCLKPAIKTGALWIARGNGRILTSTGWLQIARAQTTAGIAIDKLMPFAENEVELKMMQIIHTARPNLFEGMPDPLQALFLLRAIHIPIICRGILYNEAINNNESVGWLSALSAYSVAFERTLFERLFRAKLQAKYFPKGAQQFENWAAVTLGNNMLNWFDHANEGYGYWLSRFNQWHEYAMRSLDHYLGSQSIDHREMTGKMKEAAHLGILKNLEELPENRVADLLDEVNSTKETRKMYRKNAKKRRTTPANLEFASWLIELWPLVLEYGWSYRDVQRVAAEKYESDSSIQKLIEFIKELKKHCKKIGLKISRVGSFRIGRPRGDEKAVYPAMFQVALFIDGLVDHEWFWGKADGGFKDFKNLPRQS